METRQQPPLSPRQRRRCPAYKSDHTEPSSGFFKKMVRCILKSDETADDVPMNCIFFNEIRKRNHLVHRTRIHRTVTLCGVGAGRRFTAKTLSE